MTLVRHATKKATHYIFATGTALWARVIEGLSHAFSSHASWSARAWSATSDLHDASLR